MMSYVLQDKQGQIKETHSISAGLDYPGVAQSIRTSRSGKVHMPPIVDDEALTAFKLLSSTEGIFCLEVPMLLLSNKRSGNLGKEKSSSSIFRKETRM